ncbi:amidophosphoribosyltransferase [Rubrimonas cliftonensis]|uniref:Amidophosphoribosyltransferase n=1 Tax=Rubrimonas cliftonensis TaxID=89524 RepID=A0A1H3YSP5_9RHOB|nr:amidophosphoribosyltransferase [Rubrimonas cliftonensis]SEA14579.1 amidophosphoribosyltransferase [Rubrimonas cliftonensis]
MTGDAHTPDRRLPSHPFDPDDDKLREECGVYGVFGAPDAASFVALGLHALQHRGQEAAGVAAHEGEPNGFNIVRRLGHVRDSFTTAEVIKALPGRLALGHVRYSTAGAKGATAIRDVQPLYAEFAQGGFAIAHNGNIVNADALRAELIERGSIFQSSSDTECIVHLMARSIQRSAAERMKDALRRVEGAYSIIAMTRSKMIGVRDPLGVRPLVLGRAGDAWILSSESCALDIVGAEFVRDVAPGEMVIISDDGVESQFPFQPSKPRFCVFEYVYFSRPDSVIGGLSVYETRRRIGVELAREAPVEADLICPVPDSGTPAAIGYSQESGVPYAMGIIRNQYVGRTFIEPSEQIRNMGVRLKLNVNRAVVAGKRVVLVDDSVVRGTTSRKIKEMVLDAGAAEVHLRIASPPTTWPCFYGVDTPDKEKLLAATMSEEEMRDHLGVDSLRFVSLDGLYRACGVAEGRDDRAPQFCDACFSGDYPVAPSDRIAQGRLKLAAE